MDRAESPSPEARKKANVRRLPLYIRLYFQRHMTELVQRLGYREVPVQELQLLLAPLVERYGEEVIVAARDEILETIEVVRLTQDARRIARQILGPPPGAALRPGVELLSSPQPPPTDDGADPPSEEGQSAPPEQQSHDNEVPATEPSTHAYSEDVPPDEAPPTQTEDERYAAAYEAHEGPLYCCDRPNLKWSGEIDNLAVTCESCGYVLFAREELMPDGDPPGIILDVQEPINAEG